MAQMELNTERVTFRLPRFLVGLIRRKVKVERPELTISEWIREVLLREIARKGK